MRLNTKKIKAIDYQIATHFLPHKYSYAQKVRGTMILKSLKKGKVLDVGVGCGWFSRLATEKGINVKGIDSADKVIVENKWFNKVSGIRINIKKASVYKIPFRKESFDSVVMSEVLEHLEDPKKATSEINRVLKKKGKFILLIPGYFYNFIYDRVFFRFAKATSLDYDSRMHWKLTKHNLAHKHQFEDVHRLGYTIASLTSLIESSGFEVLKVENTEFLSPFFNTVFCNLLGFKREKIKAIEKMDTVLMKKVPLSWGTDWMFICQKI